MSEFSFEKIVNDLENDAENISKVLQKHSNFPYQNSVNIYPGAIKSLKETLSLIREYDWSLQYSEYEHNGNKELALWEQNGQGQVRNHKRYIVKPATPYLFKGKRIGTGETVCGCYMPDEYTKAGNAIFDRHGNKYCVEPTTIEPCTAEEEEKYNEKI